MSKRDFFVVIIKLFGLYAIITSLFFVLPSSISFLFYEEGIYAFVGIFGTAILLSGLYILLIQGAPWLVRTLKLEEGYDDDRICFDKLDEQQVFRIGIFIIGGYLFVENLVGFVNLLYHNLKSDTPGYSGYSADLFNLTFNGVSIFVGYLLVRNMNWLAQKLTAWKITEEED